MDRILEQVQSGAFDPAEMFTGNKDKFLEVKTAIEGISNNLTKETCIELLTSKIMPTAFDKNMSDAVRDEALEIGFHLLRYVNLSNLSTKEQEKIFTLIEDTYSKSVGELRDRNYPNWDRLWIFLMQLCHEKLHNKVSTTNKLLRVIEVAFRNSTSAEQRLKAYDCWKHLIDNSSLNMDYMCTPKQIKLLMTPMKAKFSRMPVVLLKRCDTFVYLLEKLQDKAVLCLREFLEFCFGPLEEKNDAERTGQGKTVPEICIKGTKVLIEIIGHSHSNLESCMKSDDIHLNKQVINNGNFSQFAEILIKSVVECCILLDEWNKDSTNVNTVIIIYVTSLIIKCLWHSILNLINTTSDETRIKCRNLINYSLRRLLQRIDENKHFCVILANMIGPLINDNIIENLREIVFDIAMSLFQRIPLSACPFDPDEVLKFVTSNFEREDGFRFSKVASTYFKSDTKCENLNVMCDIWLKCHITITPPNVSILIWPIRYLENFNDTQVLNSKWVSSYKNECKTENVKASVIQEIEKLFQENPLLSSNVVAFLQLVSEADARSTSNFVSKFLRLIEIVLTLPNLSGGNIKNLSAIISSYCDQKKFFYKSESNDEAIDKLCACLEHLITIHKDFSILSDLATHLKDANLKNLAKFSKRLTSFLEALMLNEDNSVVSSARKLIELLETKEKSTESVPFATSRSLRIVNMANVTPKSNQSLRLFGKSVEKSPLASRGSKLSTTPRSRKSEDKKKIQLCDEKSSDYVPIETEVKVDFNNMSEHQKEVLKKRREDIPALYQDLTQNSESMDIISNTNSTESKENVTKSEETQENENKRKREGEEEPDLDSKRMKLETSTQKIEEFTSNENEEKAEEARAIDTPPSKDESVVIIESDKSATKASDLDTSKDESVVAIENDKSATKDSDTSKDESVAIIENDKSATKEEDSKPEEETQEIEDTRDKSIRKSARQAKKKLEEESKSSQKTNDGSFLLSSKDSKVPETPQRRSSRQVIRKQFITVREKKKPTEPKEEDILRKECINDILTRRIEEIKMKSDGIEDIPTHVEESKMIEQELEEEDLRNESIEDLLARVDRRIEENRRKSEGTEDLSTHIEENKMGNEEKDTKVTKTRQESPRDDSFKTLPDGNQNKIISLDTNQSPESAPIDVYEFTGDDIPIEEVKKSRKSLPKKKNRTSFNHRDYIKKRKKTKREKVSGYPFHVTADSSAQLPLSRSSTLRTIASDQESETITIVITSSPPETDKKPQSVISEDVIESSQVNQESKKKTSSRRKSSPKRRSRAMIENVVKRNTRSSPVSQALQELNLPDTLTLQTNEEVEPKTNGTTSPPIKIKSRTARRLSLETNTSTQQTNEESEPKTTGATPPPIEIKSHRAAISRRLSLETNTVTPQADKEESAPKTPNTTSPPIDGRSAVVPSRLSLETNTFTRARRTKRTVSLGELDSMEPVSFLDDLKKQNTPEETLPDTLTVNETRDDLPASPITCDTPDRTEEFLNSTLDISPIQAGEEVTSASTPKSLPNETTNVRVARLLQMVNPNVPVKLLGSKVSSPSTSKRVRKMRMRKEENLDILTFSREVPSPLTVPTSGILKRKFANLEDTPAATPSPKRKRVNFPDPAITDKKIFIKDVEEYSPEIDTSTKESQDLSDLGEHFAERKTDRRVKLGKMFLDEMDKEEIIFAIKEFCNSQIQNDNSSFKNALKCLIQNLKLPEIAEIISDSILNFDCATIKDISTNLLDSGNCTNVVDKVVVPFLENAHVFDIFLPKLFSVLQRLPHDKLQCFTSEFVKVFGENEIVKEELAKQQIDEHVNKLDCDSMKDLIHKYVLNLEDQKRNDFIVDVMNMTSGELPVNKEFVNFHVDLLQNFVKRMTD